MGRKFKTNQRNKKITKNGSCINSRYLDKMMKEGTPVGSNEWTKRRAIENAIERAKDAEAERKKAERKNKSKGGRPSNW